MQKKEPLYIKLAAIAIFVLFLILSFLIISRAKPAQASTRITIKWQTVRKSGGLTKSDEFKQATNSAKF